MEKRKPGANPAFVCMEFPEIVTFGIIWFCREVGEGLTGCENIDE
jgi:hypothetical protein